MIMELTTALLILGSPSNSVLGPKKEIAIILQVAEDYGLTEYETKLLIALRACENGKNETGLEYGVGSDNPKHPARRFAGDPEQSLELQAGWAAGTIAKRYRGDLAAFMQIWNPSDPNEVNNVRSRMEKEK